MNVVRDKVRCGGCGSSAYTIRHIRDENEARLGGEGSDGTGRGLELTCTQCRAVTDVVVVPAKIRVEWGDGVACGGWEEPEEQKKEEASTEKTPNLIEEFDKLDEDEKRAFLRHTHRSFLDLFGIS